MKNRFTFIIIISFSFALTSKNILNILNNEVHWKLVDSDVNEIEIYSYKDKISKNKFIQIKQPLKVKPSEVFKIVKDIENYNNILSDKSITSKIIRTENDTIYGYQLISNSIPFTRDRQYTFKMYQTSENKLNWIIVNDENLKNDDIRKLVSGAGTWEIVEENNESYIIKQIFVDDKVNLPGFVIDKLRRKHVVQIFKDILDSLNYS